MSILRAILGLSIFAVSCSATPPDPPVPAPAPSPSIGKEEAPLGRLPADTRPTHVALELEIVPGRDTFRGKVAIDVKLERARDVIWLHGNGLAAESASVTPKGGAAIAAHYEQIDPTGVVKLGLDAPVAAGEATIAITFNARFNDKDNGLYKVVTQGDAYAYTQMEPVWARKAFPCFDEPAFKVPWDVQLVVQKSDRAVANSREVARKDDAGGLLRVAFATTEPLPSYLLAFAVGPLDIVDAPPIPPNATRTAPLPFRGIATKGRGRELAHALTHTPAILKTLEDYFAIGYPYDKLDIIAVPGKSGAMENVGLVTFREWLLLVDEAHAPVEQRRAFAFVMSHELSHMWFGDLVTMPWWDDIWLNEAFATWMGYRAVGQWNASYQAESSALTRVHDAMTSDSLLAARQIRQPVVSDDDIHNAFDHITYRKGGGVLAMFERWLGADTFQKGMRAYMNAHRFGSATVDDLLKALSEASGKDVATPFRTFLFQPGLPNVDVALSCGDKPRLSLKQSRYLPLGSKGDSGKLWQIPLCVRYQTTAVREQCTLLTEREATLELDGCPSWVIPNAGGVGYYQWSLSPALLDALVAKDAIAALSVPEKLSLARSIRDGFWRGSIAADRAFTALEALAGDEHPAVATAPMGLYQAAREWLDDDQRKALEARAAALYRKRAAELGWQERPGDSPDAQLLRRDVLSFMAFTARDEALRKRALALAGQYIGYGRDNQIHKEVIDPNAAGTALMVYAESADPKIYDALLYQLDHAADEEVRGNLLRAISATRTPQLAQKTRDLMLHPVLRTNEITVPLGLQLADRSTRGETWTWLTLHIDELLEKLPERLATALPSSAVVFCGSEDADRAAELFTPRLSRIAGGRRELDMTLERIRVCEATKGKHLPALQAMLAR